MSKHLSGVMVAAFVAAMLFTAPAFADHRPGNVVVMGGTASLTGRYAVPDGRVQNARKLYVDELNARGGLLGHKVEYRIFDDKSDRQTALRLYEKLIMEDEIDLFLGPYGSNLTDAVANVMERYRRPFFGTGSAPIIFQRGRKYVFQIPQVIASDRQTGALYLAKAMGIKRIAVIGGGELFPRQVTEGALNWAKKLGLEVVLLESYRKGQTEFTALLERIKASGAEAIFSNGYYDDTVAQTRQLRELNINVKMFSATVGPTLPQFLKELGGKAEFVLGSSQWQPQLALGHPGMKAFIENYEKRYDVKPNYHAADGYAVMQIAEAVLKKAGGFDPEKVRDAMSSIELHTVKGPYKPTEQGMSPIEGVIIQIQNGKRVIVWPAHQAEAKFLPMPKWEDRARK